MDTNRERMRGALLGTAVGDALGLPAEGVGAARIQRLFPGPWRHRLVFGKGMISDDTEHCIFVAQALLAANGDVAVFQRRLGWSLRWWLLALPAGVGLGTLRAVGKSWLGFRGASCGVFSAGNGPAMRVAPIAAVIWGDEDRLQAFVHASTVLTHSDPRAETGALVVARAVAWAMRHGERRPSHAEFVTLLLAGQGDAEWDEIVSKLDVLANGDASVAECARTLGLERGVSGYVYHSVPVALYAWWRHYADYNVGLSAVLDLGGDTDTVGAIVGGMLGASVGEQGIPIAWIEGIVDWPRGVPLVRELADRLADPEERDPVRYAWLMVLPRNLCFLVIVLLHGFRRLLPPY